MQRFRTITYRSLRDPLMSGLLITGLFAFMWVLFSTLNEQGMLAVRLDYAFVQLTGPNTSLRYSGAAGRLYCRGILSLAPVQPGAVADH